MDSMDTAFSFNGYGGENVPCPNCHQFKEKFRDEFAEKMANIEIVKAKIVQTDKLLNSFQKKNESLQAIKENMKVVNAERNTLSVACSKYEGDLCNTYAELLQVKANRDSLKKDVEAKDKRIQDLQDSVEASQVMLAQYKCLSHVKESEQQQISELKKDLARKNKEIKKITHENELQSIKMETNCSSVKKLHRFYKKAMTMFFQSSKKLDNLGGLTKQELSNIRRFQRVYDKALASFNLEDIDFSDENGDASEVEEVPSENEHSQNGNEMVSLPSSSKSDPSFQTANLIHHSSPGYSQSLSDFVKALDSPSPGKNRNTVEYPHDNHNHKSTNGILHSWRRDSVDKIDDGEHSEALSKNNGCLLSPLVGHATDIGKLDAKNANKLEAKDLQSVRIENDCLTISNGLTSDPVCDLQNNSSQVGTNRSPGISGDNYMCEDSETSTESFSDMLAEMKSQIYLKKDMLSPLSPLPPTPPPHRPILLNSAARGTANNRCIKPQVLHANEVPLKCIESQVNSKGLSPLPESRIQSSRSLLHQPSEGFEAEIDNPMEQITNIATSKANISSNGNSGVNNSGFRQNDSRRSHQSDSRRSHQSDPTSSPQNTSTSCHQNASTRSRIPGKTVKPVGKSISAEISFGGDKNVCDIAISECRNKRVFINTWDDGSLKLNFEPISPDHSNERTSYPKSAFSSFDKGGFTPREANCGDVSEFRPHCSKYQAGGISSTKKKRLLRKRLFRKNSQSNSVKKCKTNSCSSDVQLNINNDTLNHEFEGDQVTEINSISYSSAQVLLMDEDMLDNPRITSVPEINNNMESGSSLSKIDCMDENTCKFVSSKESVLPERSECDLPVNRSNGDASGETEVTNSKLELANHVTNGNKCAVNICALEEQIVIKDKVNFLAPDKLVTFSSDKETEVSHNASYVDITENGSYHTDVQVSKSSDVANQNSCIEERPNLSEKTDCFAPHCCETFDTVETNDINSNSCKSGEKRSFHDSVNDGLPIENGSLEKYSKQQKLNELTNDEIHSLFEENSFYKAGKHNRIIAKAIITVPLERLVNESDVSCSSYTSLFNDLVDLISDPVAVPRLDLVVSTIIHFARSSRVDQNKLFVDRHQTPPPLVTHMEKVIVDVLLALDAKNIALFRDLILGFSTTLIAQILHHSSINVLALSSLCRIYTLVWRRKNDMNKPRALCCDILTKRSKQAPYILASICGVWPEVLQFENCSKKIEHPLALVFSFLVFKKCALNEDSKNQCGRHLLSSLVKFPSCTHDSSSSLLKALFEDLVQEDADDSLSEKKAFEYEKALEILCRRETWTWAYDELIVKRIYPFLNEWIKGLSESKSSTCFAAIVVLHLLASVSHLSPMSELKYIHFVIGTLNKFVLSSSETGKVPFAVQETAFYSLLSLHAYGTELMIPALNTWYPKYEEMMSRTTKQLVEVVRNISVDNNETLNGSVLSSIQP